MSSYIFKLIETGQALPVIWNAIQTNTPLTLDLRNKDQDDNTLLMSAIEHNNYPLARLLINEGADINALNGNGSTALMFAVYFENEDMAALLLSHGADYTVVNKSGVSATAYAEDGREKMLALIKQAERQREKEREFKEAAKEITPPPPPVQPQEQPAAQQPIRQDNLNELVERLKKAKLII